MHHACNMPDPRLARVDAVDRLKAAIGVAQVARQDEVTVPTHVAQVLLQRARDGVHKGQGRARPSQPSSYHGRKRLIVQMARERKQELRKQGSRAIDAELEAPEEASSEYRKRTGRKVSPATMLIWMQTPTKTLK